MEQGNPDITDKDIAIYFFRGLDNARYAGFKTEIMNLLTSETLTQPAVLNVMFQLANQWLKSNTKTPGGIATTFATTTSKVNKKLREKGIGGKNKQQQQQLQQQVPTTTTTPETMENGTQEGKEKKEVKDKPVVGSNSIYHLPCLFIDRT